MTRKELQTIRDLRGKLAEAEEDKARMRRVEQIACRDAAIAMSEVEAIAHAAMAAKACLDAGHQSIARELLGTVARLNIDHLRARVAREPGGVLHKSDGGEEK